MSIFISWSKAKSRELAHLMKDVLQTFGKEAFVSEEDIIAGENVQFQINKHIETCDLLVLCFTHENKRSPWLLYEAGMARGLGKKVIPILFDKDPSWDSWIDNPMNYTREIDVSSDGFEDEFIKAFSIPDNQFIRKTLNDFITNVNEIKEKNCPIDVQCEELVDILASNESFQVQSPVYKNKIAYFAAGFETTELWDAIVNSFLYTGKYLWIYGRKNMKLVLHHKELFEYLSEKTDDANMHGIDFRCLFLDPSSKEVAHAHMDQDIFVDELNSTIRRLNHMVKGDTRLQQCFRMYSNRRDKVIIRLDNCILFSKPMFNEEGYPQIMTNSSFQVFSATSQKGIDALHDFENVWNQAIPMY